MSVYFTEDHEWIKVDDDTGTVGISPYAAGQLGDCLLYTSPSPRDKRQSRMPSSA